MRKPIHNSPATAGTPLTIHHIPYMHRCITLARMGAGYVAPNPMVGAVLVHDGQIIGEGWHRQYGQAHAEVNCINDALAKGHAEKIAQSVLYVSLEPCAHHGKTPPCADLIIRYQIPRVVIGCRDPFPEVNGKGIEKLVAAGIALETGVLEKECRELNKRFFCFHEKHRPYVILKWAQTADGFIAGTPNAAGEEQRLLISNAYSNRLVHRWRSEEAAILIGTQTALLDNPSLTNRLWTGPSPVRLVLDMQLCLPHSLQVFNTEVPTIVFNTKRNGEEKGIRYYQIEGNTALIPQLMNALHELKLQSVFVEGGARMLQSFIDAGCWDEARVITAAAMRIGEGLPAPRIADGQIASSFSLSTDTIELIQPTNNH